jgi:hypothetical protein
MLRIAGWFSAVFFLILGGYFEITALCVLFQRPRNATEWIWEAIYSLVPIGYGISVIWRLKTPPKKSDPQTRDYVDADAANDAELAAIIRTLTQPNRADKS